MKYIKIILLSLLLLTLAAFAVAYIVFLKKNVETKTLDAEARKNVSGSFVQLTDGITHYELAGPDTGKTVILVHGFSVPYYIGDSTFPALVKAGYRVLRYDTYGRGFSDRPDVTYDAALFRRQLSQLLQALNIHSVYAMAGVSFGGPVTADFVTHYAGMVSRVILIDPVYPNLRKVNHSAFIVNYSMAVTPGDMVNGQLTDLKYPSRFPTWGEQYKTAMQYKGFRNALVCTLLHYAPPGAIVDNYKALDSLHKQVLLIWGREDNTVPFKNSDSLRQILHTTFLPVDDAAHLPIMEKAGTVNDAIISFLK